MQNRVHIWSVRNADHRYPACRRQRARRFCNRCAGDFVRSRPGAIPDRDVVTLLDQIAGHAQPHDAESNETYLLAHRASIVHMWKTLPADQVEIVRVSASPPGT